MHWRYNVTIRVDLKYARPCILSLETCEKEAGRKREEGDREKEMEKERERARESMEKF